VRFLLDTNAVIAIMKGRPGMLAAIRQHHPSDFGLPVIVMHELQYGAHKGGRVAESLRRISELRFEVLTFDKEDAEASGEVRALLASTGQTIGPFDVLIAGQALARGLILITHNTREFARVPGLLVEDWEAAATT
jgi:tRNA(fMet)-specific endonuclease VapC